MMNFTEQAADLVSRTLEFDCQQEAEDALKRAFTAGMEFVLDTILADRDVDGRRCTDTMGTPVVLERELMNGQEMLHRPTEQHYVNICLAIVADLGGNWRLENKRAPILRHRLYHLKHGDRYLARMLPAAGMAFFLEGVRQIFKQDQQAFVRFPFPHELRKETMPT